MSAVASSCHRGDNPPGPTSSLLPGALAALGAGLVLAYDVTWGVALHWDSTQYIAAARNLLAGNGFHQFNGTPYVWWPPLYPLLLAVASLDVFDPLAVAGPVNAVIFGLTIFVVVQYLRRRLESRFLVVWAGLSLTLAAPLAESASWAMTEPLFILLATLALIRTDDYLTGGNKTSTLAWAAVCAALAWQTRYLGAAVVAAVTLFLLCQRGARPTQRARRAAGFALAAAAPMALWLARNRLYTGNATGPRNTAPYSLPEVLSDLGRGFANNWVYFDLPLVPSVEWLRLVPAAGLLVVGGVFIGAATRRSMPRMPFDWRPCYVFGGFALIYFMLTSAAVMLGATFHGFQPRFLTPMYVPLLVTAAFALDRLLSSVRAASASRTSTPTVAGAVVIAVLCVWTVGAVEPGAREIAQANSCLYCRGYSSSFWADSETLEYVRQNRLEGVVYSNHPEVVYLHSDNDAAASYHYLPVEEEKLQRWGAVLQDYEYVVWVGDDSSDYRNDLARLRALFGRSISTMAEASTNRNDLARLRALFGLAPVAKLADGAVFVVFKDSADPRRIAYEAAIAGNFEAIVAGDSVRLAARSVFDLYFDDDANTLTYFKEPCATDDVTARFMLHVEPSDPADLSDHHFANLDFDFGARGALLNGRCAAVVAFDYEISHIRTGQFVAGNPPFWETRFSP